MGEVDDYGLLSLVYLFFGKILMGIFIKMKLTEKQRQIIGIIFIIGIFLLIFLLIAYTNIYLEKLFTDDNIKCLNFCFNGENFSQQWMCNC